MLIIADSREGGIADFSKQLVKKLRDKCDVKYVTPRKGKLEKIFFYLYLILFFPLLVRKNHHINIQCLIWPVEMPIIMLSKIFGRKVSFEAHDDPLVKKFRYRPFLVRKLIFNMVDVIVTHSRYCERQTKKLVSNEKIIYIPMGLFSDIKKTGKTTKKSDILFSGYIDRQKGIDILLRALKIVKNKIPNVKLVIWGPWKESKSDCIKLIEEEGIRKNVRIADKHVPTEKSYEYFSKCKIVVLPHRQTTQSSVPFVAYTYKKPVIASDVGGLPEVVRHGKTGFIFRSGDHRQLSNYILKLLKNEEMAKKMGVCGYKLITSGEFSWGNITKKYIELSKII